MHPERAWFAVTILCCGAIAGLVYHVLFGTGRPEASALYGLAVAGCVMLVERGYVLRTLQRRVRRLPPLLYVPAAELIYVVAILVGHALAGGAVLAFGWTDDPPLQALVPAPKVFAYAFCVAVALVFIVRARDLIGQDAFVSLIIGRYHRPVREERVFLFVDVVGSTAYAEAYGDLAAQAYLSEIFAALAEPVRRHRGATDDYVGDMALITWPMARGMREARCVACMFAILDAIEAEAPEWIRRFGRVPRLRMALHCGSVVTADVGVDRHKIAFFGDTVNATGRIEALSRTLDAPLLASRDVIEAVGRLPGGIRARDLGAQPVRGRGQPLRVVALEREGAQPEAAPAAVPRPQAAE